MKRGCELCLDQQDDNQDSNVEIMKFANFGLCCCIMGLVVSEWPIMMMISCICSSFNWILNWF